MTTDPVLTAATAITDAIRREFKSLASIDAPLGAIALSRVFEAAERAVRQVEAQTTAAERQRAAFIARECVGHGDASAAAVTAEYIALAVESDRNATGDLISKWLRDARASVTRGTVIRCSYSSEGECIRDGACYDAPGDLTCLGEPAAIWRHRKRGTSYRELGRGKLQAATGPIGEGADIVAYQGDDGTWHFRERGEFEDGRFERLL